MCWQIALPLLLSAGGAAAQNKAQHDVRHDQDRIAAEGILKQAQMNREAGDRVSQTTQQIATSNPDAEVARQRATYTDALRKSLGSRNSANPVSGNVSGRFADDSSDAKDTVESDASKLADLTAQIEAPATQRQNEGVALDNTGVDLSMIRSRSMGQDYLTRLRMAMQRPNAALMAGGQLMGGAGAAISAGGGLGSDANVWADGSSMSGLDANTRRMLWSGGAPARVNTMRGAP